ncbi:LytTR family DNA-binding domain-containing protein [Ascidiimonas aurantiaca]|uniref:LytR/AlgR family response regulator transcription factor n=1 Tax=Ascidiimonas aurantiaca TaxID=1685432 RepID=UPI0030EDD5CC
MIKDQKDHNKVLIKTKKGAFIRPINDIMFILAEGSYSELFFTKGDNLMMSKNLSQIRLPDERFCRIHASVIINISFIKRVRSDHVVLTNDRKFAVSQRRRKHFFELLDKVFYNL